MIVQDFVKNALLEDIGRGDLFERIYPDRRVVANVIAKEKGVFSGEKYARALMKLLNLDSNFRFLDGDEINSGDTLLSIKGSLLNILQSERTLLNILQHSSGIATNVRDYVEILKNASLKTKLLDTRKTRPFLRVFEKYSVLNGGGLNHRLGIDDCLMIKDTHLSQISNLESFILEAKAKIPFTTKIEIECNSFDLAKRALDLNIDIVMCDNMDCNSIKDVVNYRNKMQKNSLIEASGNINKSNILDFAKTGVDAISSGALIHHSVWLDLSLRVLENA